MPYQLPPLEVMILLGLTLTAIQSRFRGRRHTKKQLRDELDRVLFY